MTQNHQKKYLTSSQLYFLPFLQKIHHRTRRDKAKRDRKGPMQPKSIEQVIRQKNAGTINHSQSFANLAPHPLPPTNLYNKYQFLPKIYSRRSKANPNAQHSLQVRPFKVDNTVRADKMKEQENKENPLDFNGSQYRDRFNKKLEEEVESLHFAINPNYSHHNLIMAATIDEQPEIAGEQSEIRKGRRCKYTRLQTESEGRRREENMEAVPSFLLKILSSPKLTI